jgi:hypothetical protein
MVIMLAGAAMATPHCGPDLWIADMRAYVAVTSSAPYYPQDLQPGTAYLGDVQIGYAVVGWGISSSTLYAVDYFEGLPWAPTVGTRGTQTSEKIGPFGTQGRFDYGSASTPAQGTWVDLVIDPDNRVAECDETNNVISLFVPTGAGQLRNPPAPPARSGPDLWIADARAYTAVTPSAPYYPDDVLEGASYLADEQIAVVVGGAGLTSQTVYYVDYFEGLPYYPTVGMTGMMAARNPFGSHPRFDYGEMTTSTSGAWVDLVLDTDGRVSEVNEANNVYSTFVPVATDCQSQAYPSWVCLNGYDPEL